jgi:hypothetical protein
MKRETITVTLTVRPVIDLGEWMRNAREISNDPTGYALQEVLKRFEAMDREAESRRLMTVRPLPCERD